jgi:hypothetical protein
VGLLVVGCLLSGAAVAQDCPGLAGRYARGWIGAVDVSDDHVFVGNGTALLVIERSPSHLAGPWPNAVAEVETTALVTGLEVSGRHAFVAGEGGLRVVDVSRPEQPRAVGRCPMPGVAEDVALLGSHAMVVGGDWGLRVVDASRPDAPVEVGMIDTPGWATDVAAAGVGASSYAYVADRDAGLRVVDVSTPTDPVEAGSMDLIATGVAAHDGLVYVAGLAGLSLTVVDASTPEQPTEVSRFHSGDGWVGPIEDGAVALADGYAYVAGKNLVVVNVSDPSEPLEVREIDLHGRGRDVAAARGQAYATTGDALYFIDASIPQAAAVRATWSDEDRFAAHAVAASGRYAYTVDWHQETPGEGYQVFDVSGPEAPIRVGADSGAGTLSDVAAQGSFLYVVTSDGAFRVVDVSDPQRPVNVATLPEAVTSPSATTPGADVEVSGDHAYVAGDAGLSIIDVLDPAAPNRVARVSGQALSVAVDGDRLCLVQGQFLRVFHVADRSQPSEVGWLQLDSHPVDVEVAGGLAYLLWHFEQGALLSVVDISVDGRPPEVGSLGMWHEASWEPPARRDHAVQIVGDRALVALGGACGDQMCHGAVVMVDVSDPSNPVEMGRFGTPGAAFGVLVHNGRMLLADGAAGLAVYDGAGCLAGSDSSGISFTSAGVGTTLANRTPVSVAVTGRELSCAGGPESARWQLWVDGRLDGEACTETTTLSGWYPEGEHVLRAVLVADDGAPLQPPVEDWIPVTIRDHVSAIAAAASTTGAAGSDWGTDAALHVPGSEPAEVRLRFLEQLHDGTAAVPVEVSVPAGGSLMLADVVAATFGASASSGSIVIRSSQPLVVTSRTFNTSDHGTYGQHIPAVPREAWARGQEPIVLLQLTGTERFRTNIGLSNLHDAELLAAVELYEAGGSLVETLLVTVLPWSHLQLNQVFAGKRVVEDGFAVVSAASAEARYLTYASVVDNTSGDPVYIAAVRSSNREVVVPAAAHTAGLAGTTWRTDLEVYSAATTAARYRLELLEALADNTHPQSVAFNLASGTSVRYRDVLESVFSADGAAGVRVAVDSGEVMVTSRTSNDLGSSSYGQLVPGLTLEQAIHGDEPARLVQLAHSANPDRGFRTNIGLVSATNEVIEVDVELFRSDGAVIGRRSYALPPIAYAQDNDVFRSFTEEDVDNGFAVVRSASPDAVYFAWASVVDNRSGDPTFIPAQHPAASAR